MKLFPAITTLDALKQMVFDYQYEERQNGINSLFPRCTPARWRYKIAGNNNSKLLMMSFLQHLSRCFDYFAKTKEAKAQLQFDTSTQWKRSNL